jgi:Ring finger domain
VTALHGEVTTLKAQNLALTERLESSVQGNLIRKKKLFILQEHLKQQCAVCLDENKAHNEHAQLKCSHVFHADCSTKWFTQIYPARATSPICRALI